MTLYVQRGGLKGDETEKLATSVRRKGKERARRREGGDRSPRRGSHSWLPVNCPNKNVRAASASFFFFFLSFSRGSRAIAWAPP